MTEPIVIDRSRFGGFEIVAVSRPYEKDGDAMVDIGVRLTRWGRVRLFLRKLRTVRVTRS